MQIFPIIASESEEEFDFSPSNVAASVHISNNLDILEIISNYMSNPFTLIVLELPTNSYMIACTNTQNFEEGESCASTISVKHSLGSDMNLFGSDMILFRYDMILFGSIFKFQELSVMLVDAPINFGVKNQVPQVSFKIVVVDLISFHTLVSDMKLFGSYIILLDLI